MFPVQRLKGLASALSDRFQCSLSMDNVFISHVFDKESQSQLIKYQLPLLLQHYNVRLVIIDSVAGNFRYGAGGTASNSASASANNGFNNGSNAAEDGGLLASAESTENMRDRAKELYEMGSLLKKLAYKYSAVVLCVNQVTSNWSAVDDQMTLQEQQQQQQQQYLPSLGLTWSQCVNTRIQLLRTGGDRRRMRVVFSHYLPPSSIQYAITAEGLSPVPYLDPAIDREIDDENGLLMK
jgi:RecA/RadA recombinase